MECGCLISTTSNSLNNSQKRLSNQKTLDEHFKKEELNSERQKQTLYKNSSHVARVFEILDTLRKDEVLCDIKLETEDGTVVYGHKVVLASATPYFRAMFTSFEESKKSHVILQELDSIAVKLLVDFIYTGEIMVTEDNVQVLLPAANLLQLNDVKQACCDFLPTILNSKNCLSFKALVSLYDCEEYLSNFKSFVLQHFSEVIEYDEFLNLTCDELIELISCNELNDTSEEIVFECVVKWVNHSLSDRKDVFPKLMGHVRLPLVSKEYLYNRVREEPLIKSSIECRDYLDEALYFHLLKSGKPDTIRTKPRTPDGLQKVILVVGREENKEVNTIQWFDPSTNTWQQCSEISIPKSEVGATLAVLNDQLLFDLQHDGKVYMFDLFSQSPCLKESVSMLNERFRPSVGVLDNCIYMVCGENRWGVPFNNAVVFNFRTQNWRTTSEMSYTRSQCGVGVLNNHLYAVGGFINGQYLKSVERYCPRTDTWTPVADMNERRSSPGIGTLNGVIYAVGGTDENGRLRSVEAYNPSSNTWTFVSSMLKARGIPSIGVVAFNGFLYVIGHEDESYNYSAEMYDPKSNIWTMLSPTMNLEWLQDILVVNKPPYFKT